MAKTRRQANRVIDGVIEYARRLMSGGSWKPATAPGDAPAASAARGPRGEGTSQAAG
jgi:hypothetical protein